MKAFYGSRFSPNMTRTPEGFLICHNVPIARTGTQNYLASEVGGNDDSIVVAYRLEEDVFAPSVLASFEGKPVTDDHPAEMVDSANYCGITKGTCTNVRRGEGDESDMIVADLVIMDSVLISEIEAGKREVSCGYSCKYVPYKNGFKQVEIVGNHVAVVNNGRAGSKVAIKDKDSTILTKGGKKKMGKKKDNIFLRMFGVFINDEDTTPEDVKEAADALNDLTKDNEEAESTNDESTKADEVAQAVADALSPLVARISALEARVNDESAEEDVLDEFEKELSGNTNDDDGEDDVTEAPEDITTDEEAAEETATTDNAMALALFKAIRPTLDSLPQAQKVAAIASFRKELVKVKSAIADANKHNPYGGMLNTKNTMDSNSASNVDFGANCRKRNPHFKG